MLISATKNKTSFLLAVGCHFLSHSSVGKYRSGIDFETALSHIWPHNITEKEKDEFVYASSFFVSIIVFVNKLMTNGKKL